MWKRAFGLCGAAAWLGIGCATSDLGSEATSHVQESVVRGTPVPVSDVPSLGRPYVVLVLI